MAAEGGVFCAGSLCQTALLYVDGAGKKVIQKRFEEQLKIFLKTDVDCFIAEVSGFPLWAKRICEYDNKIK